MPEQIHHNLIDDVMDAYIDWRHHSADVDDAYQRWTGAVSADTALAFSAYRAALDREELASRSYARLIRRNSHLFADDLERAARLRDAA
jgi:hypothetical protein